VANLGRANLREKEGPPLGFFSKFGTKLFGVIGIWIFSKGGKEGTLGPGPSGQKFGGPVIKAKGFHYSSNYFFFLPQDSNWGF